MDDEFWIVWVRSHLDSLDRGEMTSAQIREELYHFQNKVKEPLDASTLDAADYTARADHSAVDAPAVSSL